MLRHFACMFVLVTPLVLSNSNAARGEEAAANHQTPVTSPPASALSATQLQLYQYFYVDFPRAIQSLDYQTQLAEAELTLIARRVNGYRPFRSFHQYAATYTVDQQWQLAYLAAQQRLQCLRNAQADLWRQRQTLAALFLSQGS